ncbi:hypothetical protein LSTR_LSTR007943 [Laodelphax striatellus]|uniref:Uncharacterized protein n=1 Tax=Laodelphax striatellus TaxID=195883 RepID=A0A482XGE3_LAOST|nr:hypothetical protein LSTR_LSTR007943 [Laodelphax striatellus]
MSSMKTSSAAPAAANGCGGMMRRSSASLLNGNGIPPPRVNRPFRRSATAPAPEHFATAKLMNFSFDDKWLEKTSSQPCQVYAFLLFMH